MSVTLHWRAGSQPGCHPTAAATRSRLSTTFPYLHPGAVAQADSLFLICSRAWRHVQFRQLSGQLLVLHLGQLQMARNKLPSFLTGSGRQQPNYIFATFCQSSRSFRSCSTATKTHLEGAESEFASSRAGGKSNSKRPVTEFAADDVTVCWHQLPALDYFNLLAAQWEGDRIPDRTTVARCRQWLLHGSSQ